MHQNHNQILEYWTINLGEIAGGPNDRRHYPLSNLKMIVIRPAFKKLRIN